MDIKLYPSKYCGELRIPSSKSVGHRQIICSGLADGVSVVSEIALSQDILATNSCLEYLGVKVENLGQNAEGRTAFRYTGNGTVRVAGEKVDCGESGSTLRFFIPIAALCEQKSLFVGRGKLPTRPLGTYFEIFDKNGISYKTPYGENGENLPLEIGGGLKAGYYEIAGNISSQFVSGMLFALPLAKGGSVLKVLPPVESADYIAMTLDALRKHGIVIEEKEPFCYEIKGNQKYKACCSEVEGDWSQAAFWLAAGTIAGNCALRGLDETSLQGDKACVEIMKSMGAKIAARNGVFEAVEAKTRGALISAEKCPDLVPILSALASVSEGETRIINAARLRIKECDRLAAMRTELNKLGAEIEELPDGLVIKGKPEGLAGGGEVSSWNDHRIAMSLAIVAAKCKEPFVLRGAESVKKSYPDFWKDYVSVGGKLAKL